MPGQDSIKWMRHKYRGWRIGRIWDNGFSIHFTPLNGDRSSSCHKALIPKDDIRPLSDPLPAKEILQAMERLKMELKIWTENCEGEPHAL